MQGIADPNHPGGWNRCPCDECRERRNQRHRERYWGKPGQRERELEKNREYLAQPDVKERRREQIRRYQAQPHVKERQRKWREENRDRLRENRKQRTRNYEQEREYRARNHDEILRRRREAYAQDPSKRIEQNRRYESKDGVKERRRERLRQWRARNPGRVHWYDHQPEVAERRNSPVGKAKRARYWAKLEQIPEPCAYMRWTPEDDVTVMRDDISNFEKAFLLGRSYNAVLCRRTYLRRKKRAA